MPQLPMGSLAAAVPKLDAKTSRLICATIGQRLRRDLDVDEKPMPHRLALLLSDIQQREAEG